MVQHLSLWQDFSEPLIFMQSFLNTVGSSLPLTVPLAPPPPTACPSPQHRAVHVTRVWLDRVWKCWLWLYSNIFSWRQSEHEELVVNLFIPHFKWGVHFLRAQGPISDWSLTVTSPWLSRPLWVPVAFSVLSILGNEGYMGMFREGLCTELWAVPQTEVFPALPPGSVQTGHTSLLRPLLPRASLRFGVLKWRSVAFSFDVPRGRSRVLRGQNLLMAEARCREELNHIYCWSICSDALHCSTHLLPLQTSLPWIRLPWVMWQQVRV